MIPILVQLGGSTIQVLKVDNGINGNKVGECSLTASTIKITTECNNKPTSNDYQEASYYHELVHGILQTMGEFDKDSDERFVEGFANLLHQAIKTAKYD